LKYSTSSYWRYRTASGEPLAFILMSFAAKYETS
jgi:hypothetical protein